MRNKLIHLCTSRPTTRLCMTETPKPPLRPAFIFRREGKRAKMGRWLECGSGRIEKDGAVNLYLDRLPIGGFSGHVHLVAIDGKPPEIKPERPLRSGDDEDDDEDDGDGDGDGEE
jgi:hypothetical protein